ncbi:MAG: hypothetical protein U0U09_15215 [Cyclobacteriaceae bacterium]
MSFEEKEYITLYKKQKEIELGWGDSQTWTSQDFEKLSELILQRTGIRLSESTLKRVWGKVKYNSAPTATTLNTLAQFSGFADWREFKSANEFKRSRLSDIPEVNLSPEKHTVPKKPKRPVLIMLGILSIALLAALFAHNVTSSKSPNPIDLSQVNFNLKLVSNDLPNSVVFDYSIGANRVDTLKIQQSWDPQRQELISPSGSQHTSIYYYPGFFIAKLIADDVILKERDVFIKTDGWKGIISQAPVPVYLSQSEINRQHNSMSLERGVLTAKTGKTVFNDIWTDFYNVGGYHVSSEHFTLDVTLQNTSTKEEAVCQQARVTIITTKGAIVLPLIAKGCISAISVFDGEKLVNGKDSDLSLFGCDFSTPQKLSCLMSNRKMIIFLNGKKIFTSQRKTDLGTIVGIAIGFEGTGKVFEVKLK